MSLSATLASFSDMELPSQGPDVCWGRPKNSALTWRQRAAGTGILTLEQPGCLGFEGTGNELTWTQGLSRNQFTVSTALKTRSGELATEGHHTCGFVSCPN